MCASLASKKTSNGCKVLLASNHPVHFAPVSNTDITFASRLFLVSSCFASLIAFAISFLWVNDRIFQRSCAILLFFKALASSSGGTTVRSSTSFSITTSTMSPGATPAPLHRVLFTGIMWQPPIGINDERNGNLLIVPLTGTRLRVPKVPGTSTGGVIAETTLASLPSIFTRNRSFLGGIRTSTMSLINSIGTSSGNA